MRRFPFLLPLLLITTASLASVCFVHAQTSDIISHYLDESGVYAPIYNGKIPPAYSYDVEGTFFLESLENYKGSMVYDGKLYTDLVLNLNVHLDELYISKPGKRISSIVAKEFVSSFTLSDMHFEQIRKEEEPGVPQNGYYQVLYKGPHVKMLKRTRKLYGSNTPQEGHASHIFTATTSYYVVCNGIYTSVKNKGSFLGALASHKKQLKQFIKENALEFSKGQRDNTFARCAAYFDSLDQ